MGLNPLKEKWGRGEAALGAWLSIPSTVSAEVVSRTGFDYVCLDLQHGALDYQVALSMLQVIGTERTTPLVRVPANDFAWINKVLDAGALGVVIPLVNSGDEARAAVRACRYPPEGDRSFGPVRVPFQAGSDYVADANAAVACIPMIETAAAVEAMDEILAVPGVDAVYIGPNDLSLSLGGGPGLDNPGPFQSAYERIAVAAAAHGVVPGIHANGRLARKHIDTGYRMITVSSDAGALGAGAARDLRTARDVTSGDA